MRRALRRAASFRPLGQGLGSVWKSDRCSRRYSDNHAFQYHHSQGKGGSNIYRVPDSAIKSVKSVDGLGEEKSGFGQVHKDNMTSSCYLRGEGWRRHVRVVPSSTAAQRLSGHRALVVAVSFSQEVPVRTLLSQRIMRACNHTIGSSTRVVSCSGILLRMRATLNEVRVSGAASVPAGWGLQKQVLLITGA